SPRPRAARRGRGCGRGRGPRAPARRDPRRRARADRARHALHQPVRDDQHHLHLAPLPARSGALGGGDRGGGRAPPGRHVRGLAALRLARGPLRPHAGDRHRRPAADRGGGAGRPAARVCGARDHLRPLPQRGRLEPRVRLGQRAAHRRALSRRARLGAGPRRSPDGADGRRRLRRRGHDPRALGLRDPERGGRAARAGPARVRAAAPPGSRARPRVRAAAALLRLPDLRWLGAGTLLNSVGMMGELVVLGWLALELTNSPFLVGAAMGCRALPLAFVGVPAGVLADRVPRQRLLVVTGVGQAAATAVAGALTLLGVVTLGHLLLLTFVAGGLRGIEHAERQSYAHDVVGAAALVNGLAVLGIAMRAGWLLGSLGVGALIAHLGSGHAYLAVAAAYLAGGLALLPASAPAPTGERETGSLWRGVTGFFVAVRADSTLRVLMLLTAGAEVLGFAHQALLPSLSRDVLHTGPEGLGVMNAARA